MQLRRELAEAMAEAWAADMAKDGIKIEPKSSQGQGLKDLHTAPVLDSCLLNYGGHEQAA